MPVAIEVEVEPSVTTSSAGRPFLDKPPSRLMVGGTLEAVNTDIQVLSIEILTWYVLPPLRLTEPPAPHPAKPEPWLRIDEPVIPDPGSSRWCKGDQREASARAG